MRPLAVLLLLILTTGAALYAQDKQANAPIEKRQYFTKRLADQSIKLDGIPNDPAWDAVEWAGDFTQYDPANGGLPAQRTAFKILYDNRFLYIAYQALDSTPGAIVKRLGRRDDFPGDWVEINIDSYHDLRTAFSFTLSVSGVRGDEFVSNDGNNWDGTWNPIWYAKTHVDDKGWTAEIKIPLSQLRYGSEEDKVWGLQVKRYVFRKQERSTWQFISKNSGVWVSGFGELRGLKGIPSQKQVEIAPYVSAQASKYKKQEGNPFATGADGKISAGVDGKVAVTSDLMLDFTVNPDFGQVEADPSQVRIDGFQSYFDERRPFFMESRNIFDYQLTGSVAGGDYDADLLFYSRRIGSQPHGYPSLATGEYAKVPENTAILGAAKFSGKTKDGWSIGVLESITARENATIDLNGDRHNETVEPLTSYFVGRLQKDINGGNTVLGGIFTGVNREGDLNNLLHKSAYTGGVDFLHYWKSKRWYYKGDVVVSRVEGSAQAIYNTQTSFEHLFQRPNISEVHLDDGRTSLNGTGGTFKIGKAGGKSGKYGQIFKFETGLTWRSPQLELNDIGFMLSANEINHFTWAGMQFQQPFSVFRFLNLNYNHWARWDFGGQFLYLAFNVNSNQTYKNYWSSGFGLNWNPYEVSNNALRGATSLRKPPGAGYNAYINTDSRKKVVASFNISNSGGANHTVSYNDYGIGVAVQPTNALNINLSAGYNYYHRKQDQFVSQASFQNQPRTIVGEVSQKTMRLTLRVNYNITPDLTIQYYGQPFITRPLYSHYAYVVDPLNKSYDDRFHQYPGNELSYNNSRYEIDENHDGKPDYSFARPDFNFVQFRSNLVIRWEYRPGSEFYLVWSQANTPDVSTNLYSPLANSLFDNLFSPYEKNIILVKFTYRLLR